MILIKYKDYLATTDKDGKRISFLYVFRSFPSMGILLIATIVLISQIFVMVQIIDEKLKFNSCGTYVQQAQY